MLLHPNCKINIGLHITGKRADGYHTLDTLFYPVRGLYDELEIIPAETFSFVQEGIAVDCAAEDNLIVRCYRRMQQRYAQIGPVSIRFRKHIPFGAGLGGGSSDAAHTAIALNELFGLGLGRKQLAAEVTPLGADCAFFIYNVPCHATGIGEILTPVTDDYRGQTIVMVKPDIAIPTRDAYAGLDACADIPRSPRSNDFEASVFPLFPRLADIKQTLLDMGADYASLSGSGATVFGIFQTPPETLPAAFNDCFVFQGVL